MAARIVPSQEKLVSTLASFFGAPALMLAWTRLYGITSSAVGRENNAIGPGVRACNR